MASQLTAFLCRSLSPRRTRSCTCFSLRLSLPTPYPFPPSASFPCPICNRDCRKRTTACIRTGTSSTLAICEEFQSIRRCAGLLWIGMICRCLILTRFSGDVHAGIMNRGSAQHSGTRIRTGARGTRDVTTQAPKTRGFSGFVVGPYPSNR